MKRNSLGTRIVVFCFFATSMNLGPISPATASAFDGTNGMVSCGTSGNFNIENSVVVGNTACSGSASIPSGVTSIGARAFSEATSLTSITIPESVTSIGDSAFDNANSLTEINVDSNNAIYSSNNGVLFHTSQNSLVSYPAGKYDLQNQYVVPASAKSIAPGAFSHTRLDRVIIPASVTSIEERAFSFAYNLDAIIFSSESTLQTIGDQAFSDAHQLQHIAIPASVTSIGNNAFFNTRWLRTVTFADQSKLQTIGSGAFENAEDLQEIDIPASVTSIGERAFYNATSLTEVGFAKTSDLKTINPQVFYNATSLILINIPPSVTLIRREAFAFATALPEIELPALLTTIEDQAFANARSLRSVYFLGDTAPNIPRYLGDLVPTSVFTGCPSDARAWIKSSAYGFGVIGERWNGLTTQVGVYTVTYDSKGGTTVASDAFTQFGAISLQPTPPTKLGYWFLGWSEVAGGAIIQFPFFPSRASATTLYANWSPKEYIVSYIYNGATGGNSVSLTQFTTGGTGITLPTPTRSGYTFAGWYQDSGFVSKIGDAGTSYLPSSAETTLNAYAKWTSTPVTESPVPLANNPKQADDNSAPKSEADLVARTISAKKFYVAKTLAKRVGIKIVSSKATVTMSVSKSSKKICAISKSKLSTLKVGKCVLTFTVQEPKTKKGKLPKSTKTVKTLVVK